MNGDIDGVDDIHHKGTKWAIARLVHQNHPDYMRRLREAVYAMCISGKVDEKINGFPLLCWSLIHYHELVPYLFKAKADPNAMDLFARSPLMVVADYGFEICYARLLLKYGADVNKVNEKGVSPLLFALNILKLKESKSNEYEHQALSFIELLLAHGAIITPDVVNIVCDMRSRSIIFELFDRYN
jgi:hypothetical protein